MKSIALVLTLLVCVGCDSQTLTRARAKSLIEAQDSFKAQRVSFRPTKAEVDALQSAGFAVTDPKPVDFFRTQDAAWVGLALSDTGRKFFDKDPASGGLVTVMPVKTRVLEITGIEDVSPAIKEVHYEWNYDFQDLPLQLSSILKDYPSQSATQEFRHFDDGWRVSHD
jgi:hypothetical protein